MLLEPIKMSDSTESSQLRKMTDAEFSKLTDVQKLYVKRFERFNKGRAKEHVVQRTSKRKWGLFFSATILGIYFYTIFSVKQERLGEEYDQRITDKPAQNQ